MLILVGVTVNIALNGGLFTTAKDAVNRTQVEADRETLQGAVIGTLDTKTLEIPNANALLNNLPRGWEVTGNGPFTCTSPNNNSFRVDKNGTIRDASARNSTELERYIFGEEGLGRNLFEILDPDTLKFTDEDVELLATNDFFYIKYDKKVYRFLILESDEDTVYSLPDEGLELMYEQKGREGKIVKFDADGTGEKDWTIIYDNGENVEIICTEAMGNLKLGYEDEEAQNPGDIDRDGVANTNIDKSIYSYNNAIKRLNDYCKSLVTNINVISVRSVGSNPDHPYSENSNLYKSEYLENVLDGKYNGIAKSEDENFIQDYVRMSYHECCTVGETYWLASREIYGEAVFNIYRILDTGNFWYYWRIVACA